MSSQEATRARTTRTQAFAELLAQYGASKQAAPGAGAVGRGAPSSLERRGSPQCTLCSLTRAPAASRCAAPFRILLRGAGDLSFEEFAALFAAPATEAADGDPAGNAVGWAAFDPKGPLRPWRFTRRATGPHDVRIQITHAGICHSDIHTVRLGAIAAGAPPPACGRARLRMVWRKAAHRLAGHQSTSARFQWRFLAARSAASSSLLPFPTPSAS